MRRSTARNASLGAALGAALTLGAGPAAAWDLSWSPQLRVGTRATDNVRFASRNQEAALGFDNGGGLLLKAENPQWWTKINPTFNFRRFAIGENLDADEYGVTSEHQWQASERLLFGAKLDYERDSTLTTELSDAGTETQVANRDTVRAQPSVTYLLDERTMLTAGYLYADVSFDTHANGRLVDYRYQQLSGSISHAWRSNVRFFLNGFASEFEVDEPKGRTRTYGTMGGVEYLYRPDLGATLAVGYTTSDIDFETRFLRIDPGPPPRLVLASRMDNASNSGPLASVNLFKDFEHTRTRFEYARRVSPSIRGSQQLEDDILLTAEHDLSREWRIGFRGGYNMRSSEFEDTNIFTNRTSYWDLSRDQAVVAGWTAYKLNREMTLRAEYRFARNSFDETRQRDAAYNHALFMTFVYNGEPHFLRGF